MYLKVVERGIQTQFHPNVADGPAASIYLCVDWIVSMHVCEDQMEGYRTRIDAFWRDRVGSSPVKV